MPSIAKRAGLAAGCAGEDAGGTQISTSGARYQCQDTRTRAEVSPMNHERIMMDPAIMLGKPTVRGTRITVEHILRKLGEGRTVEQIVVDHPNLSPDDVRAAREWLSA
jgi:uncharacterized protein (DUF433 family)